MIPDASQSQTIMDLFLAHGIVGAVALVAIGIAAYFYKQCDKQRDKYEIVIAKLNEDRITEMREGMKEIAKALSTVETANEKFEAMFELLTRRVLT